MRGEQPAPQLALLTIAPCGLPFLTMIRCLLRFVNKQKRDRFLQRFCFPPPPQLVAKRRTKVQKMQRWDPF